MASKKNKSTKTTLRCKKKILSKNNIIFQIDNISPLERQKELYI